MKVCRRCSIKKLEIDFSKRERLRKKGLCKACDNKAANIYRLKNRNRINARRKLARTPEQNRHFTLKQKYGIGLPEWNDMFERQKRRCYICKTVEPRGRGWQTDHDHSTGKIRSILCHSCNSLLGHAKENTEILGKAIHYLCEHRGLLSKYSL